MSLAETVRNLGAPRLVVAGDVMLDRYVFGAMERISPEAPIGVLRVAEEEVRLGGAGSVARNLAVLGARVTLCGFLGTGPYGDDFLALAADAGIDTGRVRRVPGRRTSLKTRLIARRGAGGQQVLRVDREDDSAYPLSEDAALTQSVLQALGEADLLVLSDYAKGALSPSLVRTAITAARAKGIRVLVDPKVPGLMDERYRGASVVTPNRVEASTCVGFRIDGPGSAKRAARLLAEGQDLEAAAITLDRDGICLYPRGGPGQLFDISPRDVYDVTGAGDMVISAMAMALSAGASLGDAVRLANLAAGLEVSKLGVVPISREELLEALHQEESPGRGKGRSAAELADRLAACRRRGQKIVFTNGCFDLLHAGHVHYLNAARRQGDVLIVGLNSDASVRGIKGALRPVVPEGQRAEVLAGLAAVDHIVLFDEPDPLALILALAPDVLVKGGDWAEADIVGADAVKRQGGRVVRVAVRKGVSTSAIIARILERGRGPEGALG